jgi:hypothetical protein
MEINAFPKGFAQLPADTVVLCTLQILPGILGVKKSSIGGNKYTKDYGSNDAALGYF